MTLRDRGDHFAFGLTWVIPDVIAYFLHEFNLTEKGDAEDGTAQVFYGMVSVVSIWLLWRIMRQAGASDDESLVATALLATSSTFFYYARHWLPYDLAMLCGLLALVAGIRPSPRIAHSLACGFLAACAFMMYLGYWTLAGAVVLLHATYAPASWRDVGRRLAAAAVGAAVFMATIFWLFSAINDRSLLDAFTNHAGRINQGAFSEGWSLPFEYSGTPSTACCCSGLAALGSCVWRLRKGAGLGSGESQTVLADVRPLRRPLLQLRRAGAVRRHGRLARPLVPFFCVIAAHELVRMRRLVLDAVGCGDGRRGGASRMQTRMNFRAPLDAESFPNEVPSDVWTAREGPPRAYEPDLPDA